MNVEHHVVVVPGLSDNAPALEWLTRNWAQRYDVHPHVVRFGWRGDVGEFQCRLSKLGATIDGVGGRNRRVSLLGTSAGASAVMNAFLSGDHDVGALISVCGRLRKGVRVFPTLNHTRNRPLFRESVLACEQGLHALTEDDKRKILTVRPLYDEIVPVTTMTIDGARNKLVFAVEHMLAIYLAMSVYARMIVDFLVQAP